MDDHEPVNFAPAEELQRHPTREYLSSLASSRSIDRIRWAHISHESPMMRPLMIDTVSIKAALKEVVKMGSRKVSGVMLPLRRRRTLISPLRRFDGFIVSFFPSESSDIEYSSS
eukprot:GHVU01228780.1.p1 GENE.GHVU01228780.1~~GHVU01228780.1.p1  ORF type:complete len:114 (+),score=4.83 GHVU01228780.1:583-924(+)